MKHRHRRKIKKINIDSIRVEKYPVTCYWCRETYPDIDTYLSHLENNKCQ